MIRALYTAVSGLVSQEAKMDVATNNLANMNTVGFKGDDLALKQFKDVLLESCDSMIGGDSKVDTPSDIGYLSLGSKIDETKTNFTEGPIQPTNKPTDFAIEGSGFFEVQRNDNVYYTRNGHFHVDPQGFLVDDSGDYVLDSNNNNINVGSNKIACDSSGNLTIGNNRVKLGIVNFTDYNSLQKVGDNLYSGTNPVQVNDVLVHQNSLEGSNVNVAAQIADMISIMRTFETNQKVVQAIDETLDKSANQLGTIK